MSSLEALMEIYPYAIRRGNRLRNPAWRDGEDIAQDIIVNILEKGFLDKPVPFLMHHTKLMASSLSRCKKVDESPEVFDETLGGWAQHSENNVDHLFLRKVSSTVSKLPDREQQLFSLVYLHDHTVHEAAKMVGRSKRWAEGVLKGIRESLQEAFGVVPPQPTTRQEATLFHKEGDTLNGDRASLAEALGVDRRVISRLITGDMKSYKGWRLAA